MPEDCLQANLMKTFSQPRFPLPTWLWLCQLDKTENKTKQEQKLTGLLGIMGCLSPPTSYFLCVMMLCLTTGPKGMEQTTMD